MTSDSLYALPRFCRSGDAALTIEVGDGIDADVNARVVDLDRALTGRALPGIVEIVPTYRTLLVCFDPTVLSRRTVEAEVMSLWPPVKPKGQIHRRWTVPVAYGGDNGMDLDWLAERLDTTTDDIVARHSAAEYRVYMIGFMPGFAYLGGLDPRLHVDRRPEPRLVTPPCSVSVGGQQAAIAPPLAAPSGWHMLGRTPVRSYDPRRTHEAFLFCAGDLIRFRPIGVAEFAALERAADAGEIIAEKEEVEV
ncbi:5-oxoprolinase subunit PxpB [Bradyrhizobium manausense]|uniref:5-oxoprolinase subunit PxpB n=1 Tax=Bradyrhizobium TaxID=374 RepID=UPI001BAC5ABE|nr:MULTISPECIES: 5-oxoprolinase subunit PxpB [Bradyrhizobium]MBR0827727.1 5-oxoprolinase subunit PxpB [Bradyrhizobium manausense]UVO26201.1 5-oxoprolinase subunit PxpB [Bradyrhizobium arachidis]